MKKKKMMWDLPSDIEEEVLCRIPSTSLGLVRSTCKRWNMLSRCDHLFANKHLLAHLAAEAKRKGPLVVMMMNYRVQLMRLNLSNEDVAVVNPEAKLIGLDQIAVREIFHCDGLLLCIPKEERSKLLVWNPYWGQQPRWINYTHNHHLLDKHLFGRLDKYTYGLGYNSSTRSYKILRFIDYPPKFVEFKIYDVNSDSWRILDLLPRDNNWNIRFDERGLSLKGNTYWFAEKAMNSFLVCFDFTTETFSPPLPLPFEAFPGDTLSLSSSSSVGGEYPQLVVLFQSAHTLEMEIWISNTIDQSNNAVSWNSKVFLSANIKQLIHPRWCFRKSVCFFIDQEKKVAVVFDKDARMGIYTRESEIAYIFFGGGVDDGSSLKQQVVKEPVYPFCYSSACYYVPSLVQLN